MGAYCPTIKADLKTKLSRAMRDSVKALRVDQPQPQPPFVQAFNDKYTAYCLRRAEAEYKKHGRWFYCVDDREFSQKHRWDEVVSYRIYWQLLARYGSLEKIPHYSRENLQKATAFWQTWQKKDGSWFNPMTGKGDSHQCNGKYVNIILNLLGADPLYETSGYGAAKLDTRQFLEQMAERRMNEGTATGSVMLRRIHAGETGFIPVLERGIELALSHISPHTGMFHGPTGNPAGTAWKGYGTTADSMKGLLRLIAYMGVENMPCRRARADTLLENQAWFRQSAVSVKRNTAEMMVQCLMESPYRSEELLKALEAHAGTIMSGEPWKHHKTGDYAAYVLMIFGPYLNWHGYEESTPRTPFTQGVEHDWRVEAGPFGRCVNIIQKRPRERLSHKNWRYDRYGLRARNRAHERRQVVEVVPATAEGWTRSIDPKGRIVLKRRFNLEKTKLQNPYLKIKWQGDIEIFINNVAVRKKLAGLRDFGAVHIPDAARKALRPGANTLMVRGTANNDALNVSAGLIDWKLHGTDKEPR